MNQLPQRKRKQKNSKSRSRSKNQRQAQPNLGLVGFNSGLAAFAIVFGGYALINATGLADHRAAFETIGVSSPPVWLYVHSIPTVVWILGYLLLSVGSILAATLIPNHWISSIISCCLSVVVIALYGLYYLVNVLPAVKVLSAYS